MPVYNLINIQFMVIHTVFFGGEKWRGAVMQKVEAAVSSVREMVARNRNVPM
jgi:hypothetical protein